MATTLSAQLGEAQERIKVLEAEQESTGKAIASKETEVLRLTESVSKAVASAETDAAAIASLTTERDAFKSKLEVAEPALAIATKELATAKETVACLSFAVDVKDTDFEAKCGQFTTRFGPVFQSYLETISDRRASLKAASILADAGIEKPVATKPEAAGATKETSGKTGLARTEEAFALQLAKMENK